MKDPLLEWVYIGDYALTLSVSLEPGLIMNVRFCYSSEVNKLFASSRSSWRKKNLSGFRADLPCFSSIVLFYPFYPFGSYKSRDKASLSFKFVITCSIYLFYLCNETN
jgi:hypothetical protein